MILSSTNDLQFLHGFVPHADMEQQPRAAVPVKPVDAPFWMYKNRLVPKVKLQFLCSVLRLCRVLGSCFRCEILNSRPHHA